LRYQTQGDHTFYTGTSSTSSTEVMRITPTGNVFVRNEVWRQYGTDNFFQPLTINGTFDTSSGFVIPLLLHSTSGFNIVELKLSFLHKHTTDNVFFYVGSLLSETGTAQDSEGHVYEMRYPNNTNTFCGINGAYIGHPVIANNPLHATMLFSKTPGNNLITFSSSSSTYWNGGGNSGIMMIRTSAYFRTAEGHRVSINSYNISVNVVGTYSLTAYA